MYRKRSTITWGLISLLIFISVFYLLVKHTKLIEDALLKSGPFAPIAMLCLYPLLAPTPIITDPITLTIAVIYGPLIGFLVSLVGNSLAANAEYYIGTKVEKAINFDKAKEKLPFGLGKLPVNSPGFLIFGRMIPGYGGKIISILAGIYKVPLKRYLWTTIVCNIPGSIILAYGGFSLVKIIKDIKLLI